jgi:hypothetical protein
VTSPQALLILQVGADPTEWYLQGADYAALAAQLGQATGPVTVQVKSPLAGQLVLSTRAAGSVRLGPPPPLGTHPSDGRLPGAPSSLYVPRATTPNLTSPGFPLEPGTDIGVLVQQIATAMSEGTVLAVPYGSPAVPGGTIVLSGASLSYAVVCPPKPLGPPTG